MDPIVKIEFVILLEKHTVWKIAKMPLPTYDYKQLSLSEIYVPIPKLWCTMHMFLVMLVMNLIHKAIISTDAHLCKHPQAM